MKIRQKNKDLDKFVQAILTGKLTAGEIIRQRELCEILETSMSPLRDTLVLLEELELIEVKPRAGIKVIYPDLDFMRDNMQFRILIEMQAISEFVQVVTDDWIDAQTEEHHETLRDLEMAIDLTTPNANVLELDRGFHRAIVGSLKNKAIAKAHEYIQSKLRIARQVHRRAPPRQANIGAMRDHLGILAALQKRDAAETRKALDSHLVQSNHKTLVGH